MNNIIKIIREDLQNFSPYSSARAEASNGQVWLNANESPWSESYRTQLNELNRYPQQQPSELLDALSNFYNISQDQLVVTRGSDEAIDLLFRLFCTPQQDKIITCNPTFGMYEVCANLQTIEVINVSLIGNDFQLNLKEIKSHLSDNVKLIFLCSPNNPTGNLIKEHDITDLCETTKEKCLIVVDEAYIEFSNIQSLTNNVNQYENLVVLRTLSKAFGLAGIRIGCLIGSREIVNWIKKILPPYPLPLPSIEIAISKLDKKNIYKVLDRIERIKKEREILTSALKNMPITKTVWPSEANFLLVELECNIDKKLASRGIVIRNMENKLNTKNVYRISIGLPEENYSLINFLQSIEVQHEKI